MKKHSLCGTNGIDDLSAGEAMTFQSIEGTERTEVLVGSTLQDTMFGQGDADVFYGGYQVDFIFGKAGSDQIFGGNGNDFLYGGRHDDGIMGGEGADIIYGGTGNDILLGGEGFDTIFGNKGDDILEGGDDSDILHGGRHADELYGNNDSDALFGGAGTDLIDGGAGVDVLTGGGGADVFVFSNASHSAAASGDIVTDFVAGVDHIDFTSIGILNWIDNADFTGSAGEFRWVQVGANTLLQIDLDGDGLMGTGDVEVGLVGVAGIFETDVYFIG